MIVQLKKVLILGTEEYQEQLLQALQQAGVLHIEPLMTTKLADASVKEQMDAVDQAMQILDVYPQRQHRQDPPSDLLDLAAQVQKRQQQIKEWRGQLEEAQRQLTLLEGWGDFSGQLLARLNNQGIKFAFWKCPAKHLHEFKAPLIAWQKRYGNSVWLVSISYGQGEIQAPATAEKIEIGHGPRELSNACRELQQQIATASEQMEKDRAHLDALQKYRRVLADKVAFARARAGMLAHGRLFGLKGWVPERQIEAITAIANKLPVALTITEPDPGENPPTLIENPAWVQSVLDIVKLYATPGYTEWDPSASIYFAFAIFFAMIVGDAGYGLLLLALILGLRSRLMASEVGARVYRLFVTLSIGCIFFGAITCTWFAIEIAKIKNDSPFAFLKFLQSLQLLESRNYEVMMNLAIYTGAVHLCIARLIQIVRLWGSNLWMAEAGWIVMIWAGIAHLMWKLPYSLQVLIGGAIVVFLFSSVSRNPIKRIGGGLVGLLGITQNFADILSYLRLFALGLATTVLGSIFNQLGLQANAALPGVFGYLALVLILFAGHTINLVLAIMGGFIHGLRLNFLEFYRYCFEGTGHDYQPFLKTGA